MNRLIPVQHSLKPFTAADLDGVSGVRRRTQSFRRSNKRSYLGDRTDGQTADGVETAGTRRRLNGNRRRRQLRSGGVQSAVTRSISSPASRSNQSTRRRSLLQSSCPLPLWGREEKTGEFRIETGWGLGTILRFGRTNYRRKRNTAMDGVRFPRRNPPPPREKQATCREKRSRELKTKQIRKETSPTGSCTCAKFIVAH
jgi:hypothetical protein